MRDAPGSAAPESAGTKSGVRRADVLLGAKAALLVAAVAVFADLPSRWAFASHEAQKGKSLVEFLALGAAVDVFTAGGWLWGIILAVLVGLSLGRWSRGRWPRIAAYALPVAVMVVAWLLLWIGGIAATEFRLQRGLYPNVADLRVGNETSYWSAALHTFWFDRYFYPGLVGFPGVLLSLAALARYLRTGVLAHGRRGVVVGFLACASALWLGGWAFWFGSGRLLPSVLDRREVSLPIGPVLTAWAGGRNINWGIRAGIEALVEPPESVARGASMIGVPAEPAAALAVAPVKTCDPHPMRRDWPVREQALVASGPATPAYEPRIAGTLQNLSQALFSAGAPQTIHVWQIALESFRALDLHAIDPRAPRQLAPFVNDLYDRAVPGYRVLALRGVYQAGIRTSQAISAVLCGLGSMPYDVSYARDIGIVPSRCLPDVLADAGFDTAFVYGEKPAFDNMADFLTAHRVSHLIVEKRLPWGLPSGGWGIGDIALMRNFFPLRISDAGDVAHKNAWSFLLTVTNHHPYGRPSDTPPRVDQDVAEAAAHAAVPLSAEDRSHLVTFAYTDEATREFFTRLERSPWAATSIVVITGDHSTNDRSAWSPAGKPTGPDDWSLAARIPALVVVPDRWVDGLAEPAAARRAFDDAQGVLGEMSLSQNDVPTMILGLLSASPQLAGLGDDRRWHTMGGQRTSPYFRNDAWGQSVVWGVGPDSHPFAVSADGAVQRTSEACGPDIDAKANAPSLEPVAGFLGALLRNYVGPCHEGSAARPTQEGETRRPTRDEGPAHK